MTRKKHQHFCEPTHIFALQQTSQECPLHLTQLFHIARNTLREYTICVILSITIYAGVEVENVCLLSANYFHWRAGYFSSLRAEATRLMQTWRIER